MATPKASYTFTDPGKFTARLQVKDQDDLIDETAVKINVQTKLADHAPTAKIHVAQTQGDTSTNFKFTVEVFSSMHTPTHLLQVRWDWDHDGVWDTKFSRAREFFHTFEEAGWQEVWCEVKDIDGSSSIEKGYYVTGKENDSMRNKEVGLIQVKKATAPRASFKTWPVEITPGTSVHFDASKSIRATEYRWDFDGDGRFETSWNASNKKTERIYNTLGMFEAILEVRNSLGETDRTERTVAVTEDKNILPVAKMTMRNITNSNLGSHAAVLRDEVRFTASGSRDEDGDESKMQTRWDFQGDGIFDTTFSTDKVAIHRYTSTGTHTPTLQVRDERGGIASTQTQIKVVANTAPLSSLKVTPAIGTRDTSFRFDATGTRDDQTRTSNLDYRFDFDGDGRFDTEFETGRSYSRKSSRTGKFTAMVEVRDHANAIARSTAEFEVAEPTPPTAAFVVEPRVGTFATNFLFDASLTRDPSGVGDPLRYRWDFDYRGEHDLDYHTSWSSNPKHRYRFKTIGDHQVRLTVKNAVGQESEFFTKVKIHEESESLAFIRQKGITADAENPNQLLTRSELAKMIVKATKIRATRPREQRFTDVPQNDPNASYIAAVNERGWITSKYNFAWQPDGVVNRAEASKVVVAALYPWVANDTVSKLKDVPSHAWYTRFVNVAYEEELLDIQNAEFHPAQPVTRAEIARMMKIMLEKYSFEQRLSNLLKNNHADWYADADTAFDAQEFFSSVLAKYQVFD